IYECFNNISDILPQESLYEKETLTWKIIDILPRFIELKEFSSLKSYLKERESSLKYFQLAEKIASLFDQYLIFRPKWIFDWQKGKDNNWQAVLWRALVEELGEGHPAQLREKFKSDFESRTDLEDILPRNIYVFGISSLPRFHVEVLNMLSDRLSVKLYHLNPCKEYWGRSDRKSDGGSLIASMGKLGRDFFEILLDNNIYSNQDNEFFTDIERKNILTNIQADILELTDPSLSEEKYAAVEDDNSLVINSCHSPVREVEVLFDSLLDMFDQDSTLRPEDIVVMAPDIEVYAPYIHAVFGTAATEIKIPYSIADRSIRRESRIIDTFLKIIEMHKGRLSTVDVLSVLEVPAVMSKFGISENELESIQHWIRDTQIRWGKDSQERAELGLPEYEENTWEAGFRRLFLGYALPGSGENMFEGILPYDNIEGIEAVTLGKFYEFMRQLCTAIDILKKSFTLKGWTDELTKMTGTFFLPVNTQMPELNKLITVITELEKQQELSGYSKEFDIPLVSYYLKGRLEMESSGQGFLKGGITFCSLLPMRSIPFSIICLIGMDHNSFPRESKSLGFDLMRKNPEIGDRSRRNDDRYLFLESLISAREKLYISFVGQSIRDNSTIPPSVLVSELIDYTQNYFSFPDGKHAFDFLVTKHKLQAFNPEYFTKENKLFSYSDNYRLTAERYIAPRIKHQPLGMTDVKLQMPEISGIDINDLISFFSNPAKYFLRSRLGIYLQDIDDTFETSETFELGPLDSTIIGGEIAEKIIMHRSNSKENFDADDLMDRFYQLQKASGRLPHGNSGKVSFREVFNNAAGFAETVLGQIISNEPASRAIDININGTRIYGYIQPVYDNVFVSFRFAKLKAKDRLKFWINYLALNASSDEPVDAKLIAKSDKKICEVWRVEKDRGTWGQGDLGIGGLGDMEKKEKETRGLGEGGKEEDMEKWRDRCREMLGELVEIYKKGITSVIKFAPNTSWGYFEELIIKEKEKSQAIKRAQDEWSGFFRQGGGMIAGDKDDINYNLCFGDCDIFDEEFEDMSLRIFENVNKYMKEL
ncbi:MAG: exodeoxyribonuclease V subunit gamma, partial [Bacteroidota bacterium]|nr:exodeoxyribonuclease V subunit gamma [Bacteroidota bacterium]